MKLAAHISLLLALLLGLVVLSVSVAIVGGQQAAALIGIVLSAFVVWEIVIGFIDSRWGVWRRRDEGRFWDAVGQRREEVGARLAAWERDDEEARERHGQEQQDFLGSTGARVPRHPAFAGLTPEERAELGLELSSAEKEALGTLMPFFSAPRASAAGQPDES